MTPLVFLAMSAWGDDPFAEWDLMERIERVNGGDLRFLADAPERPVHRHENRIRLSASSFEDGWVELAQCHSRLDPVPELQIVFNAERIRDIRVREYENIGSARVEGASVQLADIRPGAHICLSARSRALHTLGEGRRQLRNGPFMRRFLDGFYPMGVVIELSYPAADWSIERVEPLPQPGFDVSEAPGRLRIEALFEGRLNTEITLCSRRQAGCAPAPG